SEFLNFPLETGCVTVPIAQVQKPYLLHPGQVIGQEELLHVLQAEMRAQHPVFYRSWDQPGGHVFLQNIQGIIALNKNMCEAPELVFQVIGVLCLCDSITFRASSMLINWMSVTL